MENRKITKNFLLSEYGYVEPEIELSTVLQILRDEVKKPVEIIDKGRTPKEHIKTYEKIYGDDWLEHIPWGSRHLADFGKGLRAVDFRVIGFSGEELYQKLKSICDRLEIKFGCGIGKRFAHFDVDRKKKNVKWHYNY